jgi:ribonuclease HI
MLIYTDGSCRGNPGPMAIGVSIQDMGMEVSTISRVIGDGTSNVAEYHAVIEGLRRAYDMGATDIELRMDSELVVRQIEGRYQVRKDTLKPLHAEVMTLLQTFKQYRAKHVPRGQNERADELTNQAYEALPA